MFAFSFSVIFFFLFSSCLGAELTDVPNLVGPPLTWRSLPNTSLATSSLGAPVGCLAGRIDRPISTTNTSLMNNKQLIVEKPRMLSESGQTRPFSDVSQSRLGEREIDRPPAMDYNRNCRTAVELTERNNCERVCVSEVQSTVIRMGV